MHPAPLVTCRCCGATYTAQSWAALPLCGESLIPAGPDWAAYVLRLRNCPCGSTLGQEVPLSESLSETERRETIDLMHNVPAMLGRAGAL